MTVPEEVSLKEIASQIANATLKDPDGRRVLFAQIGAALVRAVLAERERCARIVDCDCNNQCERKELAASIRESKDG